MSYYSPKTTVFEGQLISSSSTRSNQAAGQSATKRMIYSILSQSRADLEVSGSSPSVSMWPHLLAKAETQLVNTLSVYTERGDSERNLRVLYLNDVALQIWQEMGQPCNVIGHVSRPPKTAVLAFGKPFSE